MDCSQSIKYTIKMKDIANALANTLSHYQAGLLEYTIEQYDPTNHLWVVNVHNTEAAGSLLQVEVIDDDGVPKCCVLQKVNVGRQSMFKFMNRLVDELE